MTDTETGKPSSLPDPKDPTAELNKLIELATQFPEIGPPLAELAFKIGHTDAGNRIVRMGLEKDSRGLEFYFVAANAARRDGRFEDVFRLTVEAVRVYSATPSQALADNDAQSLLHLVRNGFATLMFEFEQIDAAPQFTADMAAELPKLEGQLGGDAFYRSLLAQALWFTDKARSEEEWDMADELGDPERTWNARGTWYKEAERDLDKAESTYREGLKRVASSALLRHNLAQILMAKADELSQDRSEGEESETDEPHVGERRKLYNEVDNLLRAALREECARGLRRHIHATKDRLESLRGALPARSETKKEVVKTPPPEVGQVVKGTVSSLTSYGAFVTLESGHVGLAHKSELSHSHVQDPSDIVSIGDAIEAKVLDVERKKGERRLRIGLSCRALTPAPEGQAPKADKQQDGRRGDNRRRDERPRRERGSREKKQKLASLGEMLLAKLEGGGTADS